MPVLEKRKSKPPDNMADSPSDEDDNITKSQVMNIHDHRDHGYAWVVLGSCMFLASLFTANTSSYGILLPEYVEIFQVSKSKITVIQSLCAGAGAVTGILCGTLTRIFGFRKVALLGALLSASGFIVSSLTDSLYVLYVSHGLVQGLALMLMWTPALVAVASYFHKRKAFAFSLTSLGFSSGFIIWAPLFRALVTEYGWKGALLVYAGIALNGIIAALLLRPVHEHDKNNILLHDRVNKKTKTITKSCPKSVCSHITFLKDFKVVIFILSYMLVIVGHVMPYYFLPALVQSRRSSKAKSAFLLSILGIAGSISRPIFGLVADRVPHHRILLYGLCAVISGAITAGSYLLEQYVHLLVYCCFLGLITGGYISIQNTILSDLTPLKQLAVAAGIKSTFVGSIIAVGHVVAGWLVDVTGSYATPFLVFGLLQVIGGILGLVLYSLQRLTRTKSNNITVNVLSQDDISMFCSQETI